jgi:predicted nucleotidyltransferase
MLDDIVGALVKELDPEKIILFGSAARGELSPDSVTSSTTR